MALGVLGLLIMSHGLAYCEGRSDGKASIKLDLREKQVEAAQESMKRVAEGDIAGAERAEKQAQETAAAIRAIEEAEANDANALDSLF
ncbi:MAG: hypothetical protein RQ750_13885 [Roseovarius sp.]|nr:hypothetical protein [Roseovarius sp.]